MSPLRPLSGFPELLPRQRFVERAVIAALSQTFELHGFANIETRVVEPLDRLSKGGEIDKEVYVLRRLHADDAASDSGLGLHFDLTVPFARYVLENASRLAFPFRRYQIQKAWRGERPQEGRYREFTQADIDIVGDGELAFHHDVEVVAVMAVALAELPLPRLSIQVNNRKLIQGFYRGLGIPDVTAAIRTIDKLDKLPADEVARLLAQDAGASNEQAQTCLDLASIRTSDTSFVGRVEALGIRDDLLSTGLAELAAVIEGTAALVGGRVDVEANLRIARGLDYYTGTVVEIFMAGYEHLKSVGGGGRYDALASDGRTTYPGVGVSFGISRTLVPLLHDEVLDATRAVPSAVLVAVVDEASRAVSDDIARRLRARGVSCEVATSAQKFGRQIRSAQRREIPFVWFPPTGERGHEVKDIRSGDQQPADPGAWTPSEADARPRIVAGRAAAAGPVVDDASPGATTSRQPAPETAPETAPVSNEEHT
jgi:histidyl-tRNA synthetase